MNCPRGSGSFSSVLQKSVRIRVCEVVSEMMKGRSSVVMTTSIFYLSCTPSPVHRLLLKCFAKPPLLLHGTSLNCSWGNEELNTNTSVCKACINSISQWTAYHVFSLWWCASLLLVSEAQTPGWDVSLCVQVERVLCASAFLCITQPAKNTVEETWGGIHSGELHPILFSFSPFFLFPRDASSQLKGYVSQHHFNVLTPQLWGVEIGGKNPLSALGVAVPAKSKSTTWKGWFCVCWSVFTDNIAMLLLITYFTLGDE